MQYNISIRKSPVFKDRHFNIQNSFNPLLLTGLIESLAAAFLMVIRFCRSKFDILAQRIRISRWT